MQGYFYLKLLLLESGKLKQLSAESKDAKKAYARELMQGGAR